MWDEEGEVVVIDSLGILLKGEERNRSDNQRGMWGLNRIFFFYDEDIEYLYVKENGLRGRD